MITWENYEEYMMMHADGELQPHEEVALQVFLDANPQLKSEMAAYEKARIVPDMTEVYEHKQLLLKQEPERRKMILLPNWRTYGMAAGIAAVLAFGYFAIVDRSSNVQPVVVRNDTGKIPAQTTTQTIAVVPDAPADTDNHVLPATTQNSGNNSMQHSVTTVKGHTGNLATATHKKNKPTNEPITIPMRPGTTTLTELASTGLHKLPVAGNTFTAAQTTELPDYNVAISTPERRSWIDKLPIDDNKKEKLNSAADKLADTREQVSDLKQDISGQSLSIRVERRKLIFSF